MDRGRPPPHYQLLAGHDLDIAERPLFVASVFVDVAVEMQRKRAGAVDFHRFLPVPGILVESFVGTVLPLFTEAPGMLIGTCVTIPHHLIVDINTILFAVPRAAAPLFP